MQKVNGLSCEPAADPTRAAEVLMDVQVRIFGIRRELFDEPHVDVQVPRDASVRTVLNALVERFGETARKRLFSADGVYLRDMLCVAVNDRIIGNAELDNPLPEPGSRKQRVDLSVIFSIAGGAGA